jgi:hypothetical protein
LQSGLQSGCAVETSTLYLFLPSLKASDFLI